MGFIIKGTVQRVELIMEEFNLTPEDRKVVVFARQAAKIAQKMKKGNEKRSCPFRSPEVNSGLLHFVLA